MSESSEFHSMRLRLKFRNKFATINVRKNSSVEDLINSIALLLSFKPDRLAVSSNSKKFYHLCDGKLRLKDIGVISGDLIYVKSDVIEEDIRSFRSAEAWQSISDSLTTFSIPISSLSFGVALFPLDACARNNCLKSPIIVENTPNIVRINYAYAYGDGESSTWVNFAIFKCGEYLIYTASVSSLSIQMQLAVKFSKFFINPQLIDEDSRENVSVVFLNPQDLITMLSDKLIEPILVDIHQALFLPPRFGLLSLRESEMLRICQILNLRDLGRLAATCRQMNRFINTSEVLWRRLTVNLLLALPRKYNSETVERIINEQGKCPSLIAFKNLYEARIRSLSWRSPITRLKFTGLEHSVLLTPVKFEVIDPVHTQLAE